MNLPDDRVTTAVCTIVSKNYLAYARTLMNSVAAVHPDWKRYVLLADEIDGKFDPAQENFQVVPIAELPLPCPRQFLFRYDVLELNTAVKPWFLQWLFEKAGAHRTIYLDPDIRVFSPLTEIERLLNAGSLMALTPHLLAETNDDKRPNDRDILQAGCYNLGFLALSRHPDLPRFLAWWQDKLTYDCRVDLPNGLFVDQKWMDLAPGLFSDVAVLRHPGYNVAYWNVKHRPVRLEKSGPTAADKPLVFFHFSGLDPLAPAAFSKHQNRHRLKDLPACETLVKAYCQEVIDNGWKDCKNWPYAFNSLADGTPVAGSMRRFYRSRPDVIAHVGDDPFRHAHDYLNDSCDGGRQPLVTRLMQFIWENQPDLRDAFPDIFGAWREEFASHFVEFVAKQEKLSERFVKPVRDSLHAWRISPTYAGSSSFFHRGDSLESGLGFNHSIAWFLRGMARTALALAPLPRSAERIRRYYHLVKPLSFLLPAGIRGQLKREMLKTVHRKLAAPPATVSTSFLRSLVRWLRRVLRMRVDTASPPISSNVPGAETASPALAVYHGIESDSSQRPQLGELPLANGVGLNVVGYLQAESGVGESARLCVQSTKAAGLPLSLHDVTPDAAWSNLATDRASPNRHAVNLMHVNADQMENVHALLGPAFFAGKYNIGVWHWELPKFPDRWLGAFDLVDEIWAPSRFIQDSLSHRAPCPVVRIPHAIRFRTSGQASRTEFGLPKGEFLFLMMYDVRSFQQRKNPEGAIEAFRRAFGDQRGVTLVIKVNDSLGDPEPDVRLKSLLRGAENVRVLNERLDRQRTYDLLSVCDCVLSLHRAEGFGLVLAEAMFLGTPVIATGWSGNMEFMTRENSCPVDYRLVRIARDIGPYERGQIWAEPDLDHAAELMKKMASDALWAKSVAEAGQKDVRNELAPERVGELYRQRLDVIQGRSSAPSLRIYRNAA